jgi:uncharacterized protein involved in outer membrane biogenesis
MKKIFISLLVIVLLVLFTPAIAVLFFKGAIIEKGKKEINKMLNAHVNFNNDIGISVWKNFPNISVRINQLELIGIDSFEMDTLIKADEISLTINLMSVIKGSVIKIKSVNLEHASINAIVLQSGRTNWDIMKPDSLIAVEDPEDTA